MPGGIRMRPCRLPFPGGHIRLCDDCQPCVGDGTDAGGADQPIDQPASAQCHECGEAYLALRQCQIMQCARCCCFCHIAAHTDLSLSGQIGGGRIWVCGQCPPSPMCPLPASPAHVGPLECIAAATMQTDNENAPSHVTVSIVAALTEHTLPVPAPTFIPCRRCQ